MSAHARNPEHRIDVHPSTREVRITFAGETIASTRRPLFLDETGLPTRYYIPPEDVKRELLVPSDRKTTCPYKGDASYWSIQVRDQCAENAVWAYMNPLPERADIGGYFCFYPEKVEVGVENEPGTR